MKNRSSLLLSLLVATLLLSPAACLDPTPEGIATALPARTTVKMDFDNRPLPEIPLPNDLATRYDPTSATGLRLNASMLATTRMESRMRELLDGLDGWGIFQPITIPFTGELDVRSILKAHRDANYDLSDDVIYLINIDERSKGFGRIHPLDLGNGNYPVVLEDLDKYWKNDSHASDISLLFSEDDEDRNDDGVLDEGEDADHDGELDRNNYLPGQTPARGDLAGRADALMTFYERATSTLIARPMTPLDERTTYAVVITRRLQDIHGEPVGSPYPYINHTAQTDALRPLERVLPAGLSLGDVAFAFTFTTESIEAPMVAVRDGLYGHGVQAHLGRDFPPEVGELLPLKDASKFPAMKNPYVLYTEQLEETYKLLATSPLLNQKAGTVFYDKALEATHYVDFHVMGSFQSPQLLPRDGADGKRLPLNEQRWPEDLDRVAAPARPETVYFWLVVPRPEVSARGQGKPAPVVVLSHGYTSSRVEALILGAYFARYGLATLAIDCPSHGLGFNNIEEALARAVGASFGLEPFVDALLKGRAADLNDDGAKDSGGDFWTSYMFHTRDLVRQGALDYMQLMRIFRSFDGKRTWTFDPLKTGQRGIAGDFDGDGKVDVGGEAGFHMIGASLGGIMSLLVGGLEPNLKTVAPISGAGGLGDVAIRSKQGGVPEPVFLRVMGPLYTGTLDAATGDMKLETIVPDLNGLKVAPLGHVSGVRVGDTVIVENLMNGERGCDVVTPQGLFRAAVASDLEDPTRLRFYAGPVLESKKGCLIKQGAQPTLTFDKFGERVRFQDKVYAAGDPLVAIAEGLGLRRGHPELRRFISLAQVVLDPADPASFARHYSQEPLHFPGTGEQTGVHALISTTIGDMNVPASTGAAAARAAGLIDYLKDDPRYGKPPNQVLIDTHTYEAVNTLNRYVTPAGLGVHMDVDNFSEGKDMWGTDVPRLDPPLHLGFDQTDKLGGYSAAIFPMSNPTGQHGFDQPGKGTDKARDACRQSCTATGTNACGCDTLEVFDIGNFMLNLVCRYFVSEGKELELDPCLARDDCPDRKPPPVQRDKATLP